MEKGGKTKKERKNKEWALNFPFDDSANVRGLPAIKMACHRKKNGASFSPVLTFRGAQMPSALAQQKPCFTYVLRRWLEEPGELPAQSGVVIIRSDRPLFPDQIFNKLAPMVSHPNEFVLIDAPLDCTYVLDTWDRSIDQACADYPLAEAREMPDWKMKSGERKTWALHGPAHQFPFQA